MIGSRDAAGVSARSAALRRLVRDRRLTGSVATGFGSQAILVVSGVVIARALGPTNRGYYALLTLVPMILAELGNCGLPVATTYELARGVALASVARRLLRAAAVQAVVLAAVSTGVLAFVMRHDPSPVRRGIFVMIAVVPATLCQRYGLSILQGQQRFREFNWLRIAPALGNSLVLVAYMIATPPGLLGVATIYVGTTSMAAVATAAAVVYGRVPDRPDGMRPASLRHMLRFGLAGYLGSVSPLETFRLDQAAIGIFLPAKTLGIYVVAISFTNLPRFIAQSIGMVAYPDIAGLAPPRRSRAALRYVALAIAVSGATVAVLEVAVGRVLPVFFGASFAPAVEPSRILLVSALFLGVRRVLGDCARGAGRPGIGTLAEFTSWIVLVASLAVLARTHGIDGVAISVVFAAAASAVVASCAFATVSRPSGEHVAFAGIVVAICGGVGAGVAYGAAVAGAIVALGAVIVAAAASVWLLWRPGKARRHDLLNPALGAAVMFVGLFVVRPLYIVFGSRYIYLNHDIRSHVPYAAWVGAIAVAAFACGYAVIARRAQPRSGDKRLPITDPYARNLVAAGFGATAVMLFVANLMHGGGIGASVHALVGGRSLAVAGLSEGSTQYLTASPILATAAAVMLIATARGRPLRGGERMLVAAYVIFPLLAFSLLGQRRFMLAALGAPIAAWLLSRDRRPPWRLVLILAPVVFLLISSISSVRSAGAREQQGGASGIVMTAFTAPGRAFRSFATGPDDEMFSAFSVETQTLVHPTDYRYGLASIGDLMFAPLPSAVFPGKPENEQDRLLSKMFGGPCRPIGGLCPDVTAAGTFYEDLWIPGVAFGMALLGAAAAAAYRAYGRSRSPASIAVLAAMNIYLPIVLRAGFMPGVLWFLFLVLPSLIAIKLAGARQLAAPWPLHQPV